MNCRPFYQWPKMYSMPREPQVDLPPGLPEASEIFGSRVRIAILLAIPLAGKATLTSLVEQTGLNYNTMKANLSRLEDLGALACSIPRGQRSGKTVTFELVPAVLERALALLHSVVPSPKLHEPPLGPST